MLMNAPKALVLTGNGTNCDREMAHACELAGARAVIAHTAQLFSGEVRLADYHFLNLPGGFLDGDDLGSAKAGAVRFKYGRIQDDGIHRFLDDLTSFVAAGKLVLGVCNGFQLMVKMGLLPALDGNYLRQEATLTFNDCGRFQDRWVYLKANPASPSIFTRGIERGVYFPIRHGEGKFVASPDVLNRIEMHNLAVFKYSDHEYTSPTMEFPLNPNGSENAIAGICDESGRLMGLMPHPEAFTHFTNHPRWTREQLPVEGDGLILFRNAAAYVRENIA